MAAVVMYSTEPCSFCSRAKQLLAKREIAFDEINLARDPAGRAELVERTGMMSFPQILIGEHVLGGFTELVRADRSGELAQRLAA